MRGDRQDGGCSPSRRSVSKGNFRLSSRPVLQLFRIRIKAFYWSKRKCFITNRILYRLFVWANGSEAGPGWPATTGAQRRAATHTQLENTAVKANMVSEETR